MNDGAHPRRWLVLGLCCSALFVVSMDNTVLNVALPGIRRDLHASVEQLQWVVDAYVLVLASFLMLAGAVADRVGRRRLLRVGLALFTAGSALCSVASDLHWLVAFRMLQAVGGAMLNPVAMSILTVTFTDPGERARAIGWWGAVAGVSMTAGPVVGGALVEAAGWRAVFLVNLPVGIAAWLLTGRWVPESRAAVPRRLDPAGQILVVVLLASTTYALIDFTALGSTEAAVLGCAAVAVSALGALLVVESRRAEPLVELSLFRSRPFVGANITAVCAFAALYGFLFTTTIYLQVQQGLSALQAGLALVPMAAMGLVCAPVSGRMLAARGAMAPLLVSGTTMTASGLLLAVGNAEASVVERCVAFVLFGIGFGFVNAPVTHTAVSGLPHARAGVAAAFAATSRQVGSMLGVAITGTAVANGSLTTAWSIVALFCATSLAAGLIGSAHSSHKTRFRRPGLGLHTRVRHSMVGGRIAVDVSEDIDEGAG
ncbi:MFS transporter [Streptomyces sp. PTM05]|uniref:MFS transporter n=1 Tax=Streptantibioticus parmotrematis TaxID=2873249 RepID=A0ABS7QUX0_9ACTN|nr:MFS transporter [Streptantibioticus parmotrematis]MBY8886989.1 MFS transporter [Streptantibioticus parmotrematis]